MVRREDQIKALSDQFVNVRLIKCNSLDLKLFQFDYDLTFCVLFLNADRTIYARYGTRDGHDADNDVALEGLAATMRAVLEIHGKHPDNAAALAGKQPVAADREKPEEYAALDHFKPKLDYGGQVSRSCIHCHQVRDAARLEFRVANKPIPLKLLYPYPSPRTLGLHFDPKTASTLSTIEDGSPGSQAGLRAGDAVRTFNKLSIDSEADFRWMLHNLAPEAPFFTLEIMRGAEAMTVEVALPTEWRKAMDLSWRPTSWDLRRMATGGMTLKPLADAQRKQAEVADGKMALRADHVGQYGHHARAKRAGLRKGDVIVGFDGRDDLPTENAVLEYAVRNKKPGDTVEIVYLRNGRRRTTRIDLQ